MKLSEAAQKLDMSEGEASAYLTAKDVFPISATVICGVRTDFYYDRGQIAWAVRVRVHEMETEL